MKILFDQGTPVPLRTSFANHELDTAAENGWSQPTNGNLLAQAELAGYECFDYDRSKPPVSAESLT